MKQDFASELVCEILLLLARGACIETASGVRRHRERMSCSSQEEHVLKPDDGLIFYAPLQLLLARGACIETRPPATRATRLSCSSQEEHVLKLLRIAGNASGTGCSSQEEHVLKRINLAELEGIIGCSSQEEHVLKRKCSLI